ncbi:MAG: Na/Pi cotransporter family protein [Eubacteriales bacterium]|jgi:phosphate:Na+ symporter|nr:Na/Pi cotransporter family protein [Eubacteriales bacterium]
MSIANIITLLGGLGMFLYGMDKMSENLERAAGDRLQKVIEMLTSNIFKGILIGAVVTAIIQSSSATTVMVVGFVNAGIMSLAQAVGVIMGANIGTTMTAWIISLGDLSGVLSIFKPSFLAPVCLIVGVALSMVFSKNKKLNDYLGILIGFGLLFLGMLTMEQSVSVLKDLPRFQEVFSSFKNPVLGVLVGAGVTAIIQSSSASVGILQAAAAAGLVTFSAAVPIVMGQNIGTCVTALLSSIGANKNARRAAMLHLYFNLIGTVVIMALIYIAKSTIGIGFWDSIVSRTNIAQFHTVFNVTNTIILLPATRLLVWLANKTVTGGQEEAITKYIDNRFLSTPSLALSQTMKEILRMGHIAQENVMLTEQLILNKDKSVVDKIIKNEETIDTLETELTIYLTKIAEKQVNVEDNRIIPGLFHTINDLERIGDHAMNIMEIAVDTYERKCEFSDTAQNELSTLYECTYKIIDITLMAYKEDSVEIAQKIEPLEEVIDEIIESLKERHVKRVINMECNVQSSYNFMELLNNFERIGDHCSNIGISTIQRNDKSVSANFHEYLQKLHENADESYKENYKKYLERYQI